MPESISPSPPARNAADPQFTQSSVDSDIDRTRAGDGEPDEINRRALLAPPQGEGELGRLERYRILKELGRGGMGMVLLAEDSQLLRMAALKIMLPQFAKDAGARQ